MDLVLVVPAGLGHQSRCAAVHRQDRREAVHHYEAEVMNVYPVWTLAAPRIVTIAES